MKYLVAFLLTAAAAFAYAMPPDKVVIDGRILLTPSRPMDTFPWKEKPTRMSEHPYEGVSDSRELEAFWEIRDGQLYLLAVRAFQFEQFSPLRSVGLRDLMPERIKDGKVLADWFTGEFEVLEVERLGTVVALKPHDGPPMRVTTRTFHVEKGSVKEELKQP